MASAEFVDIKLNVCISWTIKGNNDFFQLTFYISTSLTDLTDATVVAQLDVLVGAAGSACGLLCGAVT